ncbi:MAG: dimethyl sulfoxide reductase anchor subunit [Hyphomicrobiales bacterium]|nr:dimethyl sulfoxide reductase anchor subunit [Hyphomicrobiales bacterium]
MHPAYSVILFTTASGAGYGLMALLGVFAAAGLLPATTALGLAGIGLAAGLIVVGLMSSTFHLGRPERAWRALTQWRSSWLAREGVLAIVTFAPVALFALGWVFYNTTAGLYGWMGAAAAALSVITVSCTAMIYASLKTIRQWNNALVLPGYLSLGLATGSLLLVALTLIFGVFTQTYAILALVLLAAAFLVKFAYWRSIDREQPRSTIASATGLGAFGSVRLLEQPHTEANFIMREMGYSVARKHAKKLRAVSMLALFAIPAVLMAFIAAHIVSGVAATFCAILAVLSAGVGVAVERWLFFAEAEHISMLYYGKPA